MDFKSPEEYFYKLNQVFSLVLAGPLVIFIILFLEWRDDSWKALISSTDYRSLITYLLIPIILGLTYLGYKGFRETYISNRGDSELQIKLKAYSEGFIRMQVFFTLSGLIAMVGLYMTGSNLYSGYYLILLFFISLNRPSPQLISKQLRLNKEEKEVLFKKLPFQNEN